MKKRYAEGGMMETAPKDRMPPMQTDEELDEISPEAMEMMKQRRRDMEQERRQRMMEEEMPPSPMKKGGKVKKMAKGGKVGSASKRGDGCAMRGKTKGRFI